MATIHWSLTDFSETDLLKVGSEWSERLSVKELEELDRLHITKRRAEWLAGRLAVKQLYRKSRNLGACIPDSCLVVMKEKSGVPFLILEGVGKVGGWLSLSHSEGKVFCALTHADLFQIGADLEKVVSRPSEFVHDFFTENEARQVDSLSGLGRDVLVNLIWSAKEAFLKAIGLGLQMDTRKVEVFVTKSFIGSDGWQPLILKTQLEEKRNWKIIWRQESGFILTLCYLDEQEVDIARWV